RAGTAVLPPPTRHGASAWRINACRLEKLTWLKGATRIPARGRACTCLMRLKWAIASGRRSAARTIRLHPASGRSRRLPDRRIPPRHDFPGHQLHRALVERGIDPVHSGIDQLTKIADLLAQGQDLVDHPVDAAVDHAVIHDPVVGDLLVRLLFRGLEHVEPL